MAERRSIYTKISVSEQVNELSDRAQVLFSWGILHADDVGLLPAKCGTLKATIMPMRDDITREDFEKLVEEIVSVGLWRRFEYKEEKYLQIVNFSQHQTLRKDRQPTVIIRGFEKSGRARKTWDNLFQLLDIPLTDNDSQEAGSEQPQTAEEKGSGREEKRSKGKKEPKQKVIKYSVEDMAMARLLWDLILTNAPSRKDEPDFDKWADEVRLLHSKGHDYQTIEAMVRWTQQDSFWSQNILSTAKLRAQFDNLLSKIGGKLREVKAKRPTVIK